MNTLLLLGTSGSCADPSASMAPTSSGCRGPFPVPRFGFSAAALRSAESLEVGRRPIRRPPPKRPPRSKIKWARRSPRLSLFHCPSPNCLCLGFVTTSDTLRTARAAAQAASVPRFRTFPTVLLPVLGLSPAAAPRTRAPGPPRRSLAGSHRSKSSLTENTPAARGNTERMCRACG